MEAMAQGAWRQASPAQTNRDYTQVLVEGCAVRVGCMPLLGRVVPLSLANYFIGFSNLASSIGTLCLTSVILNRMLSSGDR